MDIKELIDGLNKSETLSFNSSNKYDELLEYYKSLAIKYILITEKSVYNMLENQDLLENTQKRNCLVMVDDLLHGIFSFTVGYGIDKNSKQLIEKIIELNKEDKQSILKKTFKIIDAFYNTVNRSDLRTKDMSCYIKDILTKFQDYLQTYMKEIIDLVSDNKLFSEEMNFHLTNIEYY